MPCFTAIHPLSTEISRHVHGRPDDRTAQCLRHRLSLAKKVKKNHQVPIKPMCQSPILREQLCCVLPDRTQSPPWHSDFAPDSTTSQTHAAYMCVVVCHKHRTVSTRLRSRHSCRLRRTLMTLIYIDSLSDSWTLSPDNLQRKPVSVSSLSEVKKVKVRVTVMSHIKFSHKIRPKTGNGRNLNWSRGMSGE